jgi:hypothetical protein
LTDTTNVPPIERASAVQEGGHAFISTLHEAAVAWLDSREKDENHTDAIEHAFQGGYMQGLRAVLLSE